MSEPESFLRRWSKRKQETSKLDEIQRSVTPEPPQRPCDDEGRPDSKLPPTDAIEQSTDIRGFLAEHVPEDLARAALRRAWAKDPAIRDFVGLSENSWDFTAAGGVPGFGDCGPELAGQLLAQVLGPEPPRAQEQSTAAQPEVGYRGQEIPTEPSVPGGAAEVESSSPLRDAANSSPLLRGAAVEQPKLADEEPAA
jgi:Protein of unknown function (DUF3306)